MSAQTFDSPEAVVERHFQAYNDHDLPAYLATMAPGVALFRAPNPEPSLAGIEAVGAFYRDKRFCIPELRSELIARITVGSCVIDHERVVGLSPQPVDAAIAYEVEGGLITRITVLGSTPSPS